MPREDPFTSLYFHVFIPGINLDDPAASFAYCSGFNYRTTAVAGRFGEQAVDDGYAVPVSYNVNTITLKKGIIYDSRLFDYFTRVQRGHKPGTGSIIAQGFKERNVLEIDFTRDLKKQYDSYVQHIRYTFTGVSTKGYTLEPFDATNGSILMESYEFYFTNFNRVCYEKHTGLKPKG